MNKRLTPAGESYYQKVITEVSIDAEITRKDAAAIVKKSIMRKMIESYPDLTLSEKPACWAREILESGVGTV